MHAVAPGTVVYANWLRGFGNLIIVDHGQQYMTVYAYNQSLLKQVGDYVAAGGHHCLGRRDRRAGGIGPIL